MEPIIVQHTSTKPGEWRAECTLQGKTWVEVSRNGATHALARTLKESGIGDAPFRIHENGRLGYLSVPSFHAWAKWTYKGDKRLDYEKRQVELAALKAMRPSARMADV